MSQRLVRAGHVRADTADLRRRSQSMRSAALVGSIPSAIVLLYAATTWQAPNRPAMAALSIVLLVLSLSIWTGAATLASSPLRQPVNLASVMVYLCGYAAFAYLDGGVLSPVGLILYIGLAFHATSVPYRPLAAIAVTAVALYWTVVALSEPTPPGYPWIYTLGFLGITAICARHARSLASMRARLAEVARVDPLTGCLNRRGFDERLVEERSKVERTGSPFTLVLVDLDAFKAVNDVQGHLIGDKLLAWTAHTLRDTARPQDVVGRVGGDEFAVILTGVGLQDAAPLVDRLHTALDRSSPASMGAASFPADSSDLDALRHLADQRVYDDKAQRAGRAAAGPVPVTIDGSPGPVDLGVAALERRQQSIADLARISALNFGIGLVHTLLFRADAPNRYALLAILGAGTFLGLTILSLSGFVARSMRVGTVMSTFTPCIYGLAIVLTLIDGGMSSIYTIGTLTPLPIIALGTPKRTSIPIGAVMTLNVTLQAVFVGAPSGWYVAIHLAGILGLSIVCGFQGATAAGQRNLLTRMSRVDALTDCLNRRGFEERFDAELARVGRKDGTLSILVLDLDGFKAVNDTHGHAAGDELLCWVTDSVEQLVRTHDVVGRLGGDEFVVLLADCPPEQVTGIAERCRDRLAERTPVSIGSATLGYDGADFDELYRHADAALYADKARRRSVCPGAVPVLDAVLEPVLEPERQVAS